MMGYEREEINYLLSLIDDNNNSVVNVTTDDTTDVTTIEFINIDELCDELSFINPFV